MRRWFYLIVFIPSLAHGKAFLHSLHDHVNFEAGTYYLPIGGLMIGYSNEEDVQVPYHTEGTISDLYAYVISNDQNAASTLTLRKNGVSTDLTVTIGATATGAFNDTTHSVAVADGDKLDWELVVGGEGTALQLNAAVVLFDATTNSMVKYVMTGSGMTQTNWWPTFYDQISGNCELSYQTEVTQIYMNHAATIKNMSVNVTGNSNSDTTNVILRKNAVDTALAVGVTANTTGLFENTADEVSVVAGDSVTLAFNCDTPQDGDLTFSFVATEAITSDGKAQYIVGNPGKSWGAGETNYTTFMGPLGFDSGAATYELPSRIAATLSDMFLYVRTNTLNVDMTATLMVDDSASSMVITVPAGTTGVFSDETHTENITADEKISYKMVTPAGTGSILTQLVTVVVENTETEVATGGVGIVIEPGSGALSTEPGSGRITLE